MKIEVLFPEVCNLFGDLYNIRYLEKCLPEAQVIETPLVGRPAFADGDVSLLYLGPMTEGGQEKVISALRPYTARIREMIENGTAFLFTGNALEVLGEAIEDADGPRIECLGLLPLIARRDMMHRYSNPFLGSFQGREILGFKSQFTMAYPTGEIDSPILVETGKGLNPELPTEGVRVNNFFGTYLLGPLLTLNPPFTRHFLSCMGVENPIPAFEEIVQPAYEKMIADFRRPQYKEGSERDSNKLPIDLSPKVWYNRLKSKAARRRR